MRDDDGPGLGKNFVDSQKIFFLVVLVAGMVLGGLLTSKVIEPYIFSRNAPDYNSLVELNSALDERNDLLYSCLIRNGVAPDSCGAN